jgi:hypothetical protein
MNRSSWPPYHLVEESIADRARAKLDRLERLYHVGQEQAWDGRSVLESLIARHGRPRIDPAVREPALRLLSILLWGELAAWAISADLAERIDDVEAKMAATSQAHDEARHFYVLRDYLAAMGEPVPRLGGIGRSLLLAILGTPSLEQKLVGMQLLVESNALAIFRGLVEARIEPVLTELLPYYEKDEARHIGLGVMYLPRLVARLGPVERAGLMAFQLRCVGLLMSGGLVLREAIATLGMDQRAQTAYAVRLQDSVLEEMRTVERGGRRGLLNPSRGIGPKVISFLYPPADAPRWHRAALAVWTHAARAADRALA